MSLVYSSNVVVGKEKVCLRLYSKGRVLMLERELIQADGASFVHSMLLDDATLLLEYSAADPYYRQLELHYSAIQDKISALGEDGRV